MKKLMFRTLALALVIATVAAFAVVPASAAETLTNRQKALVETAVAYYLKNPDMQYDSTEITSVGKWDGGIMREHNYVSPEDSTPDHPLYTVCSSFCFEIFYDALGYSVNGSALDCTTTKVYKETGENADNPMVVYRHDNVAEGEVEQAMNKVRQLLQPGDMIIGVTPENSGHAMFYAGDCFGDGKKYIIHSSGGKYFMDSGTDAEEVGGNIHADEMENFLFNPARGYYLGNKQGYVILRPLNVASESRYPLTASAQGRLKFPRLRIDRTASVKPYGTVTAGDVLTYSIAITNNSGDDYKSLPVKETVPAGTELVAGSVNENGTASGTSLSWSVDLAAGKTVTLQYSVKVTAGRGETITAAGGSVSTIRSNTIETSVGGKALSNDLAKKLSNLASYSSSVAAVKARDTAFAETVYEKALGLDISLPTTRELLLGAFDASKIGRYTVYTMKDSVAADLETTRKMFVPQFFGGLSIMTESSKDRILDFNMDYLRAGDILVFSNVPSTAGGVTVYVAIGDGKMIFQDGSTIGTAARSTLIKALSKDFFVLLRPQLAYDDFSTELKSTMKFTDVLKTDWYYTYVKDLVADGTVAGMTPTTFKPAGTVTYGQALKLIALAAGEAEQKATAKHWASGYLTLAQSKGWLAGSPNLDGNISRLALCQIAAKALGLTEQPAANPFTDTADQSVLALNKAGVINGMTDTTFAPDKTLTRAQITKIIWCMGKL